MGRIKKYQEYFLTEDAETPADPAASGGVPDATGGGEEQPKNLKHALVAGKDFFGELEAHVRYWFKYTKLNKETVLDKIQKESDQLIFFATQDKRGYFWKVTIRLADKIKDVEKVENLMIDMVLYKKETEIMLRKATEAITVGDLSSKNLEQMMGALRRNIIHAPSDKSDVLKFNRKEKDNLADEIN